MKVTWSGFRDYALIVVGCLLQALAIRLFLVPANLVGGGISGISQLINHYTGWPIGLMVFLGNMPLFVLGWYHLGGKRFAMRTGVAIVSVSLFIDLLAVYLPDQGVTQDLVLNTLYGGLISGIGFGLVYRGQGTSGGSDILARFLNHWKGVPISQSYMLTDAVVMFGAGLTFSWENALYALVMLYVSGIVAEAVTEGSNVVRTVLIITDNPQPVTQTILHEMERGVTEVKGTGAYTGSDRTVLFVVVSRSEVVQVKALVKEADPKAFMVIGQAHEVLGEGFRTL